MSHINAALPWFFYFYEITSMRDYNLQGNLTHLPAARLLTVAVVDDDPAVCSSLKFSLELEGFMVRVYGSASELLNGGVEGADCLVIDQRMPEMTGMELIGQLRRQNVSTPAILIVSQPNAVVSARAAKADVPVVEKPFLGNSLVDKIHQACGRKVE